MYSSDFLTINRKIKSSDTIGVSVIINNNDDNNIITVCYLTEL